MTLIKTLDSYTAPTAQALKLAYADGVRAWNGYLYLPAAANWTKNEFDLIREHGMQSIAYANGNDDPVAMKELASSFGVRGCLDVESGTRPFGSWTEPWLEASGFGVYSSQYNYPFVNAAFHVVAAYQIDDPHVSWPAGMKLPPGPHGWQWSANLVAYGAHVDRSWFDDTVFDTPTPPPPVYNGDDMWVLVSNDTNTKGAWVFTGSTYFPVASPDDIKTFMASGNLKSDTPLPISTLQHTRWVAEFYKPV